MEPEELETGEEDYPVGPEEDENLAEGEEEEYETDPDLPPDEEEDQEEEVVVEPAPAITAQEVGPLPQVFTNAEVEAMAESFGYSVEQMRLQIAIQQRIAQHNVSAAQSVDFHLLAETAAAPDYFREYGPRIRRTLSQLTPEQQSDRQTILGAAIYPLIEDSKPGETFAQIIEKAYKKIHGNKAAMAPRAATLPPTQRTPVSSVGRGNGPAPRRPARSKRTDSFADTFGVDEPTIRALESDPTARF